MSEFKTACASFPTDYKGHLRKEVQCHFFFLTKKMTGTQLFASFPQDEQIRAPFRSPPRRQANQLGLNYILSCPHSSVTPPSNPSSFLLLDPSFSMIPTFWVVLSLESSHPLPLEADFSFPMLKLDLSSSLPGSLPWALSCPADTVMHLYPSPLSPSLYLQSAHAYWYPLCTSLQISTFS